MLTDVLRSSQRIYCQRWAAENRLEELRAGLGLDRTSCHDFLANQFRLLLAMAAYVLLQELRWQVRGRQFERAQVLRLRHFLLKVAVWLKATVRRVAPHRPRGAPAKVEWLAIARKLGGAGPPVATA